MKKIYLFVFIAFMTAIAGNAQSCYKDIRAGRTFTIGLQEDNTLWSWGSNAYHQLGDGTQISRSYTAQIGSDTWSKFTVGDYHVLAIKSDGTLWSWGNNDLGQLGIGASGSNVFAPTQVGTDTNWAEITTGRQFSAGIKTDGTLWTWGYGGNNALGDGTTVDKLVPTQIGTANDWAKIYAGYYHTLAIKNNGTLWVWGSPLGGGLGDGGVDNVLVPTQVGTDTNWVDIAAGNAHSVALKSNGTMWSCGANFVGQLGIGNVADAIVFTQIGTDSNWNKIAVGLAHNLAIKTDGTLWSWGLNNDGQIGNGVIDTTVANSILSPIQIGTNSNWIGLGTGSHSSFGISNTSLWAWGFDAAFGILGDQSTTIKPSPTYIDCAILLSTKNNVADSTSINAYPNPTHGVLHINAKDLLATQMELYDIQGRLILSETATTSEHDLNLEHLDNGTYLLKVTSENKSQVMKVIKN